MLDPQYRDTDVAMSHRGVPSRHHALAPVVLHRIALLVDVDVPDLPLGSLRQEQRPLR